MRAAEKEKRSRVKLEYIQGLGTFLWTAGQVQVQCFRSAGVITAVGNSHLNRLHTAPAVLLPPLLSLLFPESQFPLCNDTAGTQTKCLRFVIQRSVDRLPLGAVRRRSHLILTLCRTIDSTAHVPVSMFRIGTRRTHVTRDHQPYIRLDSSVHSALYIVEGRIQLKFGHSQSVIVISASSSAAGSNKASAHPPKHPSIHRGREA